MITSVPMDYSLYLQADILMLLFEVIFSECYLYEGVLNSSACSWSFYGFTKHLFFSICYPDILSKSYFMHNLSIAKF
ncbi:unnamed protein product [Blepharisma stoltei]|uniref:Uncharacterized protein n=1 Tax=Blepharisma stoltei TaxID=1481888 RepID=A0AAU9I924_9CILI|nr:unnamed protein product [Blepharisma stoltei]